MTEAHDAPYEEIVAAAAERLGIPVEQVKQILDTYMEESRKQAHKRRSALQGNPAYQQWKARQD